MVIRGVYSGADTARPKLGRVRRSRSSVLVLFALSIMLSLNLIRLVHVSDTVVTSALGNPTSVKATNSTTQPNIEVQTYAPTSTPPVSAAADAAALVAASTPPAAAVQAPKGCTGTQYLAPASQDLASAPLGLTSSIDPPTYYQVYGNSLSELRSAITNCQYRKAAGNYHASTSYQLNWRYSATSLGNNQCQLTNVRVGMRINQLMPLYAPTSSTPGGVASAWATYASSLATHENGHVAIDTEYAQKLLAALQNMGPLDCSLISRQAQTTIDSYVAMLNTANDLYDSRTNHGATQGAVL